MAFTPNSTNTVASVQIGNPVTGGTVPSVLTVVAPGVLGQAVAAVAGTFLRYNGVGFDYATSTASVTIGNAVVGGTNNEVLYTTSTGVLGSDSGFYRDDANNFTTVIQSTDGANVQGQIITTNGICQLESVHLVTTDNGRVSVNTTFARQAYFAGTGEFSLSQQSATANSHTYDNGLGITATLTLDANQADLRWLSGAGRTAFFQYDEGATTMTARLNSVPDNTENRLTITPNFVQIRYDNTNAATPTAIISAEDTSAYLTWNDGLGVVGTVTADVNSLNGSFTNGSSVNSLWTLSPTVASISYQGASLNTALTIGEDLRVAQQLTSGYILPYNSASGAFAVGEEVLGDSSGATGDILYDGGTFFVLDNVVGTFTQSEMITGQTSTETATTGSNSAQFGIYTALNGVFFNDTPSEDRYAGFVNDTVTEQEFYTIKHPIAVSLDTNGIVSKGTLALTRNVNTSVNHQFVNTDNGGNAAIQHFFYNGVSSFMCGLLGSGNTFGGLYTPNSVRFDNTNGDITYIVQNSANKHYFAVGGTGTSDVRLSIADATGVEIPKTITAGGTTGDQTIDKQAGSVNFAAAATSLTVTNSYVTTNSVIIATVATNDTTMKSVSVVAGAGSFVLHANAAANAETRVNFLVIN